MSRTKTASAGEVEADVQPAVSRRAAPRRPSQARGRARVEALLDAAEALTAEKEIDDIGYYDIVARAEMPAASVYHFFRTKAAIFMALAQRYFDQLHTNATQRHHGLAPARWQDLLVSHHAAAVDYYNKHPAAMKLILGAQPFLDIHAADVETTKKISTIYCSEFELRFDMPNVRDIERKFLIALGISDSIWRTSFSESGYITPAYAEEATTAVIAYFRTFLPENLEPLAPIDAGPPPGG
jgi:AcrR family transcriptional regulator